MLKRKIKFRIWFLFLVFLTGSVGFGFSVTGRILLNGSPDSYPEKSIGNSESYHQIMKKYETERRLYFSKSYLVSGGEYVAKSLLLLKPAIGGKSNPIAAAMGGQVLGDAIAYQGQKMRETIYSEMTKRLDLGLKETVLKESKIVLTEITGLPQEKARKLLTKYPEIFDFKKLPSGRQDETDLMQEAAIQVLADQLSSQAFENNLRKIESQTQQETLSQIHSKQNEADAVLRGHLKSYSEFSVTVTENLAVITAESKVILNQVKKNTNDITTNKEQISLLENSLFEKMSGKEKIEALKTGWFPEMKKTDREAQVKLAESESRIQTSLSNIQVVASNLPLAISLFTRDPKTVQDLTRGSILVSGVMSTIQAYSMSPFAAVMTGMGVLGGVLGGSDNGAAGAERHTQVMEQFKQVIDSQIKLSQQISNVYMSLAEGQRRIYELLNHTATELVTLGQRLDKFHKEEMEKLNLIQTYSLANMDLLRDIAAGDPTKCIDFLDGKMNPTANIRFVDQFQTYDGLKEHFSSHRDLIKPCLQGLNYILTKQDQDGDIHSLLLAKSYSNSVSDDEIYWSTASLFAPSLKYYRSHKSEKDPSGYSDLLHVESMAHYISLAIELYPYVLILDDPQSPSIVANMSGGKHNHYNVLRAKRLLDGALRIIDEGILQQEIISGREWVGTLEAAIRGLGKGERSDQLRSLVENNSVLKANLIRYLVNERARETNSPISYYDSLMSGVEAFPFFENFWGQRFLPKFVKDKWFLNLGMENENGPILVELPEAEKAMPERWNYTADMLRLHELRGNVVNHLAILSALGK